VDFLPHTTEDIEEMLSVLGKSGLEELFEPVPEKLRLRRDLAVPEALDEVSLRAHVVELAGRSQGTERLVCFAGGGAYDHHVPAAVSALASRAEFATSYTPYQAELSQGVLQALFEFQTLVCELFAMEIANTSLYDGANALVEAVNLAVRATGRERVVVGSTVHPHYRDVLSTYTSGLGLDIESVAFDPTRGVVDWGAVDAAGAAALVAASPNFFGVLEDVSEAAAKTHPRGGLVIAVTDPTFHGRACRARRQGRRRGCGRRPRARKRSRLRGGPTSASSPPPSGSCDRCPDASPARPLIAMAGVPSCSHSKRASSTSGGLGRLPTSAPIRR